LKKRGSHRNRQATRSRSGGRGNCPIEPILYLNGNHRLDWVGRSMGSGVQRIRCEVLEIRYPRQKNPSDPRQIPPGPPQGICLKALQRLHKTACESPDRGLIRKHSFQLLQAIVTSAAADVFSGSGAASTRRRHLDRGAPDSCRLTELHQPQPWATRKGFRLAAILRGPHAVAGRPGAISTVRCD
jgi:hypothetical protein